MFYLTTQSTSFILRLYGVGLWQRTTQIVNEETRCRYMGYYFRLTTRVRLYAPSNKHDSTYHGICYASRVPHAGRRKINVGMTYRGGNNCLKKNYSAVHIAVYHCDTAKNRDE